jgi:hypothetical protein
MGSRSVNSSAMGRALDPQGGARAARTTPAVRSFAPAFPSRIHGAGRDQKRPLNESPVIPAPNIGATLT